MEPIDDAEPLPPPSDVTDSGAIRREILARVRATARRIADRVRKVAGDTAPDIALGPPDDTAQASPLPPG